MVKIDHLLLNQEIEKAKTSFPYFLQRFVWTLDEHDRQNPVKQFPYHKQYLQELAVLLQNEKLLLIEKSRQMLLSWILCALCIWEILFKPGQRVCLQSKKEADACALLDRCKFIYDHLPSELKQAYPAQPAFLRLTITHSAGPSSLIQSLAQGPDQVRGYTFSLIVSDELAFQEQSEEAFNAAMPSIKGGGRYIGVSTPNGKETFYRLIHDYDTRQVYV